MYLQFRRLSEGIAAPQRAIVHVRSEDENVSRAQSAAPLAELLVKSKDSVDNHRMDHTG